MENWEISSFLIFLSKPFLFYFFVKREVLCLKLFPLFYSKNNFPHILIQATGKCMFYHELGDIINRDYVGALSWTVGLSA
jgi:hypothetical protein